ncbi:hypothetical protein [Sphingomonas sp. PR090111-T3T-6A]|uniref:hypothetical protein n=1 Tax=Sphingomonas sp. PR090111-T3T-6A TaxID=685778 RepID=UPI00037B29DE|nr:hypothetical protein [Sphingomonas sp. PR090111-T3T-6A]
MHPFLRGAAAIALVATIAGPAQAESPRDTLIRAAFGTHDKAQALALVNEAIAETRTVPDHEAQLQHALGVGYRGQLTRSPSDAKAAHSALEAIAAADPHDAETQVALAGWHLTAVGDLGDFLARALLGANRAKGLTALDKAVEMGGNRAFFPAYAALIRIKLNTSDTTTALRLAERAVATPAPTPLDRIMQRAAARLIPALQAGKGDDAARIAKQLLPFGSTS